MQNAKCSVIHCSVFHCSIIHCSVTQCTFLLRAAGAKQQHLVKQSAPPPLTPSPELQRMCSRRLGMNAADVSSNEGTKVESDELDGREEEKQPFLSTMDDPFSFALAARDAQNVSHVVFVAAQLDSVYVPCLHLVNILEVMRWRRQAFLPVPSTLVVLPHSRAATVVARALEYIAFAYRSVYGLNSTVLYTPDRYMDSRLYSPVLHSSSGGILTELTQPMQEALAKKYALNPETTALAMNMSNMSASNTPKQLTSSSPAAPFLPLDTCLSSDMTVSECLDLIHQEHTRNGSFVAHADREHYVFTSYFTSKADPQRGKMHASDNLNYVLRWFVSLRRLGLKAVIFHDGLGDEFMARLHHAHPGKIFFEKVAAEDMGRLSTNDFRFRAYYDYLRRHEHIHKVLCTDVSDVTFHRDPFELMTLLGDQLYVGQDRLASESMAESEWLMRVAKSCAAESVLPHFRHLRTYYWFLNAGVIGGSRPTMLRFLEKTKKYMVKSKGKNCDMVVVNYVAQRYFRRAFFTGSPLTGVFKGGRYYMSVYISHKGQ